jgi:hypothetical protein
MLIIGGAALLGNRAAAPTPGPAPVAVADTGTLLAAEDFRDFDVLLNDEWDRAGAPLLEIIAGPFVAGRVASITSDQKIRVGRGTTTGSGTEWIDYRLSASRNTGFSNIARLTVQLEAKQVGGGTFTQGELGTADGDVLVTAINDAIVTANYQPPLAAPVARNDAMTLLGNTTTVDTSKSVDLLANDDVAGTPTVRIVSGPSLAGASASLGGTNNRTLTYNRGTYNGPTATDTVRYGLRGSGNSDVEVFADATVTVQARPAPAPVMPDATITLAAAASQVTLDLLTVAGISYSGPPTIRKVAGPFFTGTTADVAGNVLTYRRGTYAGAAGNDAVDVALSATGNTGEDNGRITVAVQVPVQTGQPVVAQGMRESGTPFVADFDRHKRRYGKIYEFFRSDGERDSKELLAGHFGRLPSQEAFMNYNPGRGAINANWPIAVGGAGPSQRNAQLADAANGGLDAAWRSSFAELKRRNLTWYIFCLAIECNGNWYPWGTGTHGNEGGYQGRVDNMRAAIRRFVDIAGEFRPHNWVFCWSPTLEAWNGSGPNGYLLSNGWAGRQYIDAVWPTFYDSNWGDSAINNLPNGYSQAEINTRHNHWVARWNSAAQSGWLNTFTNWTNNAGGGCATGFHELSVFSSVRGVGQAFNTGYENKPIVHSILFSEENSGGDNPYFLEKIWDWARNPANRCMGLGWFIEQYRHDFTGFYQPNNDDSRPFSKRHRLCADYYYTRYQSEGVGNIRDCITWMINRRPAGFGTW